jgi:uncharacterized RDD family membrane protein YckC
MNKIQTPATVLRRLGAMAYDALCVFGLLLAATQIAMMVHHFQPYHGELGFQLYLLSVIVFYFAWFWSQYGQTIGMRAWSLSISTVDGNPISFLRGCGRFFAAAAGILFFGFGLLWCFWDRESTSAYDRLTGTRMRLTNAS